MHKVFSFSEIKSNKDNDKKYIKRVRKKTDKTEKHLNKSILSTDSDPIFCNSIVNF